MHPKLSVFIAASLDGYIAREDGSLDWLMRMNELVTPGEDCGYKEFIATVDALVMGRNTYEKVLTFGEWPYGELPVIILSSKPLPIPEECRQFVSVRNEDPLQLMQYLFNEDYQHVYIDGGVTIQKFLEYKLIDEVTLTLIPLLLGSGIRLFGNLKKEISLEHMSTQTFHPGLVQLKYRLVK